MRSIVDDYRNAETGEYTAEYEAFEEACMAAGATDFDCKQVASALARGLSPEAAAAEFNKDRDELLDDVSRGYGRDFEDTMTHDHSMDG